MCARARARARVCMFQRAFGVSEWRLLMSLCIRF
jgi:hypothetical protein